MIKYCLLFLAIWAVSISFAQNIDRYAVDGEIYFKFKNDVPLTFATKKGESKISDIPFLKTIAAEYQLTSVKNSFWQSKDAKLNRVYRLAFNEKARVNDLIAELKNNPMVEYAEKVPFFRINLVPNDAEYASNAGNRWHLEKINAPQAFDLEQGDASVVIAVVDNAIDNTHPDLTSKIIAAIDLADADNNPAPPATDQTWSHGTHTSGLAAAATNNSIGVASIGFNCSLIAIKAGKDADGGQGASHMFEGITWATDNGADVISLSLGGPNYHITMQMVVDYAYNHGVVVVAAAGNDGTSAINYPAGCNHVISVGATNGDDKAASFSQYGPTVDVMAPGGYQNDGGFLDVILNRSVHSTMSNTTYGNMQGTSMACPIAAGLCGLMLSADPNMSVETVEQYLKASCTNIESLQDATHQGQIGAGRINAFAAIQMVQGNISALSADFSANTNFVNEGGSVNFFDETVGTPTTWAWTFDGANPNTSSVQNPTGINYPASGEYDVTLIVGDGTNIDTITKSIFITVQQAVESAWIEQASGFATMYRGATDISIASNTTAWATASDGTTGSPINEFTRTTDRGLTWTPGSIGITGSLAPANITAVSNDKAWVGIYPTTGAGGQIWATVDGGTTWNRQGNTLFANTSASFLNVIYFFNENDGFVMGDPINNEFETYYTSDGGANWTLVDAANNPDPQSGEMGWTGVYDAVNNTAFFGTNKGRIYKTTDKGVTWTLTGATGLTDISELAFNNENTGVAIQKVYNTTTGEITTFTMKKTIDGGDTWTTVTPSGSLWKTDICAVPGIPGKFFSVGSDGAASGSAKYGSSYSLDYGTTWNAVDTGIQYISVAFLSDTVGWTGGFNLNASQGGVYKWDETATQIPYESISEMESIVYPNPVENIMNIKFANALGNNPQIIIVDMLGKLVYQSNVDAMSLNLSTDISHLKSGMYSAIIIDGNNNQTIRFIKK